MDDGFTWTQHSGHGGYFRCPNDALDDFAERGWVPCDPPEPPNPAVAEQLAWRAAQAEREAADRKAAKKTTATTTAAARGTAEEE